MGGRWSTYADTRRTCKFHTEWNPTPSCLRGSSADPCTAIPPGRSMHFVFIVFLKSVCKSDCLFKVIGERWAAVLFFFHMCRHAGELTCCPANGCILLHITTYRWQSIVQNMRNCTSEEENPGWPTQVDLRLSIRRCQMGRKLLMNSSLKH